MQIIQERDEHYSLFSKPILHEMRAGSGSENTGLYKKFVHVPRDIDGVLEYFKFAERTRRGFNSPFLTKNPFENAFAEYVEELEDKYKDLPASVAHARLIADLESYHKKALASFL